MIALLFRHWKLIGIGLAGVALLAILWGAYSAVWQRGHDSAQRKNDALQRAAEAKAAADTILLQDHMAGIDASVQIDMEAINAVRAVWRDKVVYKAVDVFRNNPDCRVPDGLLAEINAAAQGYAAAASGAGNAAVPHAQPTL